MRAASPRSSFLPWSLPWIWLLAIIVPLVLSGCSTTSSPSAELDESRLAYWSQIDELDNLIADLELQRDEQLYGFSRAPARRFVDLALSHVGTKYKWGGTSPDVGFDCSGLVWFAAQESLGLEMPRSSSEQARFGQQVKRSELREGDLVFFNTRGRRNSHVGIYVGNDRFVHAPRTGARVRIERLSSSYWAKRYNGARRVVNVVELASTD